MNTDTMNTDNTNTDNTNSTNPSDASHLPRWEAGWLVEHRPTGMVYQLNAVIGNIVLLENPADPDNELINEHRRNLRLISDLDEIPRDPWTNKDTQFNG